MKPNAQLPIILILASLLSFGCEPDAFEESKTVYLGLLQDTSGSRLLEAGMDEGFFELSFRFAEKSGRQWLIERYDASMPAQRPIQMEVVLSPPPPGLLEADYKEQHERIDSIREANGEQLINFLEQASKPPASVPKVDYTWLAKNLKSILSNLTDSASFQHRILFIDSDLKEHMENHSEQFLPAPIVKMLNRAILSGAHIYICTEADHELVRATGLKAELINHPHDLFRKLSYIVPPSKLISNGK